MCRRKKQLPRFGAGWVGGFAGAGQRRSQEIILACTDHCGGVEPFHLPNHQHDQHAPSQLGMRAIVSALNRTCYHNVRSPSIRFVCRYASLNASPTKALPLYRVQRTLRESQRRLYHIDHGEPTIYALSTASGRAAIAVIRVSGPACRQVGIPQTMAHCKIGKCSTLIDLSRPVSID